MSGSVGINRSSFTWLNVTQFLGALNDNVFKLLLIFLLLDLLGDEQRTAIIATASIVFVLPFLLFSNAAGVVADRVSKKRIIVFTKMLEVVTMTLGCVAVYLQSPPLLYGILFLMCTQSAIFGPSKYGIIPELVPAPALSRANSLLVGCSYLAIIIGTFLPSFLLLNILSENFLSLGIVSILIAVAGLAASFGIGTTPNAGTHKRISPFFFVEIVRTLRRIAPDRYLFMTVFGAAYFLFLGGFLQQNIILYGNEALGLSWIHSGYLFPVAALGIGVGALWAGRVSGRNIEFGIVPIGALGLALTCVLLGLVAPGLLTVCSLIFFVGVFSGLFIVPLNAFVQFRSPPGDRGEILAAQSFMGFLGVAVSSVVLLILHAGLGFSPRACFMIVGLLTLVLAVAAGRILPDFLVRFVGILIGRCLYRVRTTGLDNLPTSGPALLVANHVTWADAVFLSMLTQRRIRFVMAREIMEGHWLAPVFRIMRTIPISAHDPPRRILQSFNEARAALDDGYLVCIFPEGALTRTGNLRRFHAGFERIVRGTDTPIIPIYIGGAWGSILSFFYGRLLAALPRRLPYPIQIAVGDPLPPTATMQQVRAAIMETAVKTFDLVKTPRRNLVERWVRMARRRWRQPCISDTLGKRLTFGGTLVAAVALSRVVDRRLGDKLHVGICLPTTVGGILANLAVSLTGRVPVNLNYTASKVATDHAIALAELDTIVTSRAFLEKLDGFELPAERCIDIEDLVKAVDGRAKVIAALLALLAPTRALMTHRRPGPDDLATIIFSSGSTGIPKGVMLTHHNILSNIESFGLTFRFRNDDRICGILPLFHSFGFTCAMWCPLILGFTTHYHPNPIDGAKIVEIIRDERLTILMTTPTFLLAYMRRGEPDDLKSLRCIVTGAEKLKPRVAEAFEERFGIRPLEGYGTTELSPVASVNVPDAREGDTLLQVGSKVGSIGHPIPGVASRIVDPSTGEDLPFGAEGLLLIKGPNVMRGYLKDAERTRDVLRDGWYNTGDIGRMDEDGFIFLVDRLTRFSKIGGEMIPHLAIEEKLMASLGAVNNVIAVTAVPDDRKGEQLVVFYTDEAGDEAELQRIVRDSDLPNLWKPRAGNFFRLEALPTLGSGKLDLKRIKDEARRAIDARQAGKDA